METTSLRHPERVVGLFLLITVGIFLGLLVLLAARKDWFEHRYTLKATFNRVSPPRPNTAVYLGGIEIGRIGSARISPAGTIEAAVYLKERYQTQIRADSYLTITYPNLIGDPVAVVSMGSPDVPVLEEGDYIPVMESQQVTLEDILNVFKGLVKLAGEFNKGEGTASRMVTDGGVFYQEALQLVQQANAIIREQESFPIRMTPDSYLTIALTEELERTVEELADIGQRLGAIADYLLEGRGSAGKIFISDELYGELLQLIETSRQMSGTLTDLSRDIKQVTPELPELVEMAQKELYELDRTLKAVQNMPLLKLHLPKEKSSPSSDYLSIDRRYSPYEEYDDVQQPE